MSNQNKGHTGKKHKGGGGHRSGNPDRKSQDNDQKNEQGRDRQASFFDNQPANGAQHPGLDFKPKKYGNKNNFPKGNRSNVNQGQGFWHQGGQRGRVRAFNLKNSDEDHEGNLTPNDASNQGSNSATGWNQAAECRLVKTEPDDANSEKSFDSSSAVTKESIKTNSGVFECDSNLTEPNQPLKSDPEKPDELNERRKRLDHDGGPGRLSLREIEGDLFTAPEDVSLVHCVGADLRMGSGIAVRFREKFQSVGKLFDQHVEPGGVAYIPDNKRFVFYLVTKQASKGKPTNDTMRRSLLALCEKCKDLGVTKIAMPQIGCGQDGLSWNDVKQMLIEIFADGFEITVYKLDEDWIHEPKPQFKSRIVTADKFLKDIEPGTGLLYISCRDSFVSEEMKSIDTQYPFLSRLKPSGLGSTIYTTLSNKHLVYGLICKESADSPLCYEYLEQAIEKLRKHNLSHKYEYFGIQAFEEKNDPFVMEKIDTLFRNSCIDAEFWICWPPTLSRPSTSEQSYKSMQVQRDWYPSAQGKQSISPHPSHSAVPSNEWKVNEVEAKMNSHSLGDKVNPASSNLTKDEWEDPPEVPEIPADSMGNCEDEKDWFHSPEPEKDSVKDSEDYVDTERRRSREKKEANEVRKQKEKQDKRSVRPKSCVTECKGDLFDAEETMCLAHCVGADFKMGAGIAIIFRQKFGSVGELLDQRVEQGGVAYIEKDNRYIFYLVTKRESTGKPTYDTMERSLIALHKKCKELNVTELAMPRIGCGLDKLEWSVIKNMLDEIFNDGFTIKIYNLEKPTLSSPAGGRSSSWGETNINQLAATIRDLTKTTESTHRRQIKISDCIDSCNAQMKELMKEMRQISSNISDLTEAVQAISALKQRVTVLETSNNDLKKRVELLEKFPPPSRALVSNGGHLQPFGYSEGPPPLVQNSLGHQVCPEHAYYGGVPAVHPGYARTLITSHVTSGYANAGSGLVYATEQLPAERHALLRAIQEIAATNGYKTFQSEGAFFISRWDDRSDAVQINNYEDLKRFCDYN